MDVKRLVFVAVCIFTQNTFADEIKSLKNITLPSEDHELLKNLSMKDIENVTVQYIYPNNNFRKEISSKKNHTERFLYIGMEDVNDAVLIFPSIINESLVHKNNDTILETSFLKKINSSNESKSIEVDNSEYHSKAKSDNKSRKKTSEAGKIAKNLPVSTDLETKNSKLRERLANLSKLRFRNLKNAKPEQVMLSTESKHNITENTTTEKTIVEKLSVSPNTNRIILQNEIYLKNSSMEKPGSKLYTSIANGTVNNKKSLTSDSLIEKQSITLNVSQILSQDKIHVKNSSMDEPKLTLNKNIINKTVQSIELPMYDSIDEIYTTETATILVLNSSFTKTMLLDDDDDDMTSEKRSLIDESILSNDSNIYESNVTSHKELQVSDSSIDEIYTTETATILVLNSSFTKTMLPDDDDDTTFEKRSLINESILSNDSNIYESNVTSHKELQVSNKDISTQHEIPNFHVEMIPFTIEDVMITSGSEFKNYWTTPGDNYRVKEDVYPSPDMIENMIKNQVLDARKRSNKLTNFRKKKVFSKSEKAIEKSSEKFQMNSYIPQENEERKSTVNTLKNSHYTDESLLYDKNMNQADITPVIKHIDSNTEIIVEEIAPFEKLYTYENTEDTTSFDESLKEQPWYKNLQYYMPSEQPVPSRVGDLLIVGPIPKSLPSQFKYEPYKNQMKLPKI